MGDNQTQNKYFLENFVAHFLIWPISDQNYSWKLRKIKNLKVKCHKTATALANLTGI